jgi:hypothetical protein
MANYLNLDDVEALRAQCNARATSLFGTRNEVEVLQLLKAGGTTEDEEGEFYSTKTEVVVNIGQLQSLNLV